MALIDPPAFLGLAGNSYPAARMRRVHQLLLGGREGCLAADAMVATQTGTPGLSVQVSAGAAVVNGDDAVRQGAYLVESDGATTVGPVSTPHATLPRIDRLVLEVLDQEGTASGGGGRGSDLPRYRIVAGTPSSSPAPPPEPPTAITLALITVAAGASAILNASIADARTVFRVAPQWQTDDLADFAVATGKIASGAVTAAKIAPPAWQPLPLESGWSPVAGQEPQYCKDALGWVCLRGGCFGNPSSGSPVTLPAGFRPPKWISFPGVNSPITVNTGGTMTVGPLGSVIQVHFDVVRFYPST